MSGPRALPELISWNGEEHTLYEWAAITGKSVKVLRERLARYWTPEEMFTIPVGGVRRKPSECRGCKYQRTTSGVPSCDYLIITGHPRTVYKGQKVDLCPRKQKAEQKARTEKGDADGEAQEEENQPAQDTGDHG